MNDCDIDKQIGAGMVINEDEIKRGPQIGASPHSIVYQCRWRGNLVAMKVVQNQYGRKNFLRELKLLAKLDHPCVSKLLAVCLRPNLCLITNLCKENLVQLMEREPDMDIGLRIQIACDIADGMKHLHDHQHVHHRDLKSHNILVRNNHDIQICDFEFSKHNQSGVSSKIHGTIGFIAPEVITNPTTCDYRKADIFSYAMILYHIFTGSLPFGDQNPTQIMFYTINHRRPQIPESSKIPVTIHQLIQACWSRCPSDRPDFHLIYDFLCNAEEPLWDKIPITPPTDIKDHTPLPPAKPDVRLKVLFAKLDLLSFLPNFVEEKIGYEDLPKLDDRELEKLIPLMGPRSRLRTWIEEQQTSKSAIFAGTEFSSLQRISHGAFGYVYTAYLKSSNGYGTLGIPVVAKVAKDVPGINEWHEFQVLSDLPEHKNVLGFKGLCPSFQCDIDGRKYEVGSEKLAIILKYYPNGCLHKYIKKNRDRLCERKLLKFSFCMANALQHLHDNFVLHRDVALRNFVLSQDWEPVVIDFGLSRRVNGSEPYYVARHNYLLPWRWTSPERLERPMSERSDDVWMFGVTLWELQSGGRTPYAEVKKKDTLVEMLKNNMDLQGRTVPLKFNSKFSASFRKVIMDCCRFEPTERPTMEVLAQKLEQLVQAAKACECCKNGPTKGGKPTMLKVYGSTTKGAGMNGDVLLSSNGDSSHTDEGTYVAERPFGGFDDEVVDTPSYNLPLRDRDPTAPDPIYIYQFFRDEETET